MYDAHSPLQGKDETATTPRVRRQIRFSRWIVPILLMAVMILLVFLLGGCGSWLNDTRAGVMSANMALNSYDDVAVEVWDDAPENEDSLEALGVSTCASQIVQDSLMEGWAIATMIDDGIKKKKDFTQWAGNVLTVLDSLENHLEMANVDIPPQLGLLFTYLESLNPKAMIDPSAEPLAECGDILRGLSSKEPEAFPYDVLVGEAAEFALYLLNIVMDRIADKDIPEDALEQVLRSPLRQELLYIDATNQPIEPE